jgi:hypothetical protein
MAHRFDLPTVFSDAGWVLKVRDRERVEPPHVTLLHRGRAWRFGLRGHAFLDREPPSRDVPKALQLALAARIIEFTQVWDTMYPWNPVNSRGGADG